jgi:hypothetical protein
MMGIYLVIPLLESLLSETFRPNNPFLRGLSLQAEKLVDILFYIV